MTNEATSRIVARLSASRFVDYSLHVCCHVTYYTSSSWASAARVFQAPVRVSRSGLRNDTDLGLKPDDIA